MTNNEEPEEQDMSLDKELGFATEEQEEFDREPEQEVDELEGRKVFKESIILKNENAGWYMELNSCASDMPSLLSYAEWIKKNLFDSNHSSKKTKDYVG